jgi:hypothetical protein
MLFHPGYVFKGKAYKSVAGLLTALVKDSGGVEVSMVDSKGRVKAYAADRKTVIATYDVTPPKLGEVQTITRRAA